MDLKDIGVIDSGCSRHMTKNMSYRTDYEEINRGYVAFGGNPKGGKITGKGTIKTSKLDFENVYFLTGESHVLLKVPRKENMYSVDLKNIVPKGYVTCLFAKATSDESKLWHRRLGHLNVKTMNKLVKGNLVRGLPSKLFENNQDCVACQKEKQHRASNNGAPLIEDWKSEEEDEVESPLKIERNTVTLSVDKIEVDILKHNPNGKAGTKSCNDARMETVPSKDYILLPLWTADPPFSQSLKIPQDDECQPFSDHGKKVDEVPRQESGCIDQENLNNVNSTNNVNAASTNRVNDVAANSSNEVSFDLEMPKLEDVSTFSLSNEDEDDGTNADLNNLDTSIQVSPTLTIRIQKDHPLDQVIRDVQSAIQTRNMSKNLEEHRKIKEEVYVCQPSGFEDLDFFDKVYKVEKALYGLHQATRAWYETLSTYLLDNGFHKGKIDKTLFIRRHKDDILLVQVYVDDIIFGSTKKELCIEFEKMMHKKFQISSMGELIFFLGLPDIMFAVCACARYQVNPKVSHLYDVKKFFSDYARASLDRKSTTGVYTSCNKQFWATVKAKIVNGEVQLQALVDGKKVIITESTVRRDLQLEDVKGVDCLPNAAIFKQLTLMGTMASVIICLAANQKFNFSKCIFESRAKNLDNVNKFLMYPRKPRRKVTEVPQPSDPTSVVDEAVNEEMNDSLERAATTATSLDAEQDKGNIFKTQSKAIPNEPSSQGTSLGGGLRCQETIEDTVAQARSKRVSKISNDPLLARVNTPRSGEDSLKLNELMELYTKLQQIVLDLETTKTTQALEINSLKKRVKKLERRKRSRTHRLKRLYMGMIADIDTNEDIYLVNVDNDEDMFNVDQDLDGDEVIVESVDVAEQAKEVVEDITLAKALMYIKSTKPKADKVVIQKLEQGTTTTTPTTTTATNSRPQAKGIVFHVPEESTTTTTTAIPKSKSHEKGKAKMIEEPKIRKFFAAKRAEEKRNKPSTQAQQRKIMCTYLKNMEAKKLTNLKNKSFDSIQKMFDRAFKRVNTFVNYKTEFVEDSSKKAEAEMTEVKAKYGSTRPDGDYERVLWGDLKVMFEPHIEDEVWKMQQRYNVVRWTLFNSCEVHCLSLQYGHIYMLVEKRYSLIPVTIIDMLNKKLHADYFDEMTYQLLKLVLK
uniref:Retrovirus-related Pol polyprotein from transposon TNT 1-94 n=1 Tax=Tanacetum cinerariifolium TaxID=118510 RepID=A0A6L2L2B1_TANCI|nr:retrovirus-related Pol polyprotein from transposon TNT 1-94 [Tanacetum cinerariifolium]